MSSKNKIQKTASSIQHYALTNSLDKVVQLVNTKFKTTTLTNIEENSYYETESRSHINCTLMHIKKKSTNLTNLAKAKIRRLGKNQLTSDFWC